MLHPAHAAALLSPRGLLSFIPCGQQRRAAYPLPLHPLGPGLVHHCPPMPIIPPSSSQAATSPAPAPAPPAQECEKSLSSKPMVHMTHANSFVRKLYHMVTTRDQDIISFTPDGLSFHVKDPKRLEQEVLPHYFRHSRFQSLVRQLNFYNFRKTSKERVLWIYTHALFQRDRPDLLDALKRKPSTTLTAKASPISHPTTSRAGRCLSSSFSSSSLASYSSHAGEAADFDAASTSSQDDSKVPATTFTGRPARSCRRRKRSLPWLRGGGGVSKSAVKRAAGGGRRRVVEEEEEEGGSDGSEDHAMHSTDAEQSEGAEYEDGTDEGEGMDEDRQEDEEEDELDGLVVMEVARHGEGRSDDEDDEDDSVEGQAPVLLMMKRQTVVVSSPRRSRPPAVDLSPYQPTAEEVAGWEALHERWATVVGEHGDDLLYLSERLPASHLDLCRFFLHLAPFSTTAEQATALRELLETKPGVVDSLRAHYHALDPSFPDRASLFKDTPAEAQAAPASGEVSSILRALMAYGLNHLKEAVATLDVDDAARQPMEEALGLWMQHANRFF